MDLLFNKEDIKKNIEERNNRAREKWKSSMRRAFNADFEGVPKSKKFKSNNRELAK